MTKLEYPHQAIPKPGETITITRGVKWLRMPIPASLDHINLYLLEDDDGWFILDTGMGTGTTREQWHQIFLTALGEKPVKGIIVTHMHPDHVGQAGWLCEHWQAPLYMSESEYQHASLAYAPASESHITETNTFYRQFGLNEQEALDRTVLWTQRRWPIATLPDHYVQLNHGDRIDIAGKPWQVLIGRGHSPEHACLYSDDLKLLLSGDQILPEITSNVSVYPGMFDQNPLCKWLTSLHNFFELPASTLVLPAHNQPFYGLHSRAKTIIEHHEENCAALESACRQKLSGQQLLSVLFNRSLNSFETALAIGECAAHLNYLVDQNRLTRYTDIDGSHVYQTCG